MTVFLKALVDKEDEKKKLEDKLTSEENQIKEAIDQMDKKVGKLVGSNNTPKFVYKKL